MFNSGIPEKVIAETFGHKSSMALQCYERTSSGQQQAVTAYINNAVSNPVASPTSQPRMSTTVLLHQPCLVFSTTVQLLSII